ncbi:MAG: hypothetical protein LBP40_06530 [Campylobacteraceae bacterium]|jgi:hypothetical protein|nr:hypothetical protein [Campylobacteraceae bacterium]
MTQKFTKRVKDLYKREEAVFLRELSCGETEVDHRFPQIRWDTNEDNNDELKIKRLKINLFCSIETIIFGSQDNANLVLKQKSGEVFLGYIFGM